MALFTLQLVVDGEVQVLSALSRFGEYAQDLSEPYQDIADDFTGTYMPAVFAAEGPGWAPLSAAYARTKARLFPGTSILVRTGDLRDSLLGGAGFVRVIGPDTLVVGTSIPYAVFHQRGTSRMPQRKIVDVPRDVRWRWVKIVQRYLVRRAREAGLAADGGDA